MMFLQAFLRLSCVCFLLFTLGNCQKAGAGQTPAGFTFGSGGPGFTHRPVYNTAAGPVQSRGAFTGPSSSGAEPKADFFSRRDADMEQMMADALSYKPERPFPRQAWTSAQVPLGMVQPRPLFPSSHVVQFDSGYQRARDFSADAKYSMDIFEDIPLPQQEQAKTEYKGQKY